MNLTIEQMREIVAGAPEHTQVVIPCSDGVMYFAQRGDGKWFRYSDTYKQWLEYWGKCDPMDVAIRLADIKSEIDHHYYGRSEAEELASYAELSQEKIEGGAMFVGDNFKVVQMIRDITDHCTDIKNHISPNTKVINHE